MTQAISGASAQPVQAQPPMPAPAPSNGGAAANNIGPAVKMTLTNVAKPDMAKGDPDGDGH